MLSHIIPGKAPGAVVGNETTALADLVAWSESCPSWQRDALRRLCEKESLGPEDLDQLTVLCKAPEGSKPIEAGHVRGSASTSSVTLRAVHSASNVNALAEGEHLTFDKGGLTIVYGDNGSGKSGYVRILKKACKARETAAETVLANMYAAKRGVPTAVVDFTVNGQNHSDTWVHGKVAAPQLSAVRVFDTRTAGVHVDKSNQLAYTPFPVKLLASLVDACQKVRSRLTAESDRLREQTPAALKNPACKPSTSVGRLISELSNSTTEQVAELATLADEDQARLGRLRAELSADPIRTSRQLLARQKSLDTAIERLEGLIGATSNEKIGALHAAHANYGAARAAAHAASAERFAQEALPQVGSDVWRELWQAARAYSEQAAYRDQPFPFTGDGARCVLCLQDLDERAAERLKRFDAFVQDESKRREAAALDAYEAARAAVDLAIPVEFKDWAQLVDAEVGSAEVTHAYRAAIITAFRRIRSVVRTVGRIPLPTFPAQQAAPLGALRAASEALGARAAALASDADSAAYKALISERDELADREWLAGLQADVVAEINRRQVIAHIDKASRDTVTTRITLKSSELADLLVTDALRAKFAREIARLGAAELAIEMRKDKAAGGVPLFRLFMIKNEDIKLGEVLSEGEYRTVALAAFLAELDAEGTSTIVFDDPVSSLDHMHRDNVAKRLAEEATRRQIVVFTHDVAFMFRLTEFCRDREIQASVGFRSITRGPEQAGFCRPNAPANAQPIDKTIESMAKHLANTQGHYVRGAHEEWHREVRSLQEQLRTAWERCVEEVVAPVFRRLGRKVNTSGLTKLTVLKVEDCEVMRAAFGRCSALLHSAPDSLQPVLPKPGAIEAEIKVLRNWLADIRGRQDQVKDVS